MAARGNWKYELFWRERDFVGAIAHPKAGDVETSDVVGWPMEHPDFPDKHLVYLPAISIQLNGVGQITHDDQPDVLDLNGLTTPDPKYKLLGTAGTCHYTAVTDLDYVCISSASPLFTFDFEVQQGVFIPKHENSWFLVLAGSYTNASGDIRGVLAHGRAERLSGDGTVMEFWMIAAPGGSMTSRDRIVETKAARAEVPELTEARALKVT